MPTTIPPPPNPLPDELLPSLPSDWEILQLPPGRTHALQIKKPTLIIGTGPRWTSVITDSEDQPAAIYSYAPLATWNVKIARAQNEGISFPDPGGFKAYIGDTIIELNGNQGLYGDGQWFIERTLIQGNGLAPNLQHGTYLNGEAQIQRSLLFHNGAGQIGLGATNKPHPRATISRCVAQGLDGFYSCVDLFPTVHICHSTIIGTLRLVDGAEKPKPEDGNYCAPTWDQETRTRFMQPIFHYYFPIDASKRPYGAYDYDPRTADPAWSKKYWASCMADVWWNPDAGKPFYALFPADALDQWEAFMNAKADAVTLLKLQLELHGGWTNLLAHLAA